MNQEQKEQVRKGYALRLNNVVTNSYFKKFGSDNKYCKCRIDNMIDRTLNETVSCAFICYYCEWACCSEAINKDLNISCCKCDS